MLCVKILIQTISIKNILKKTLVRPKVDNLRPDLSRNKLNKVLQYSSGYLYLLFFRVNRNKRK